MTVANHRLAKKIVQALQRRGPMACTELAEELHTTRDTITRKIREMRAGLIPDVPKIRIAKQRGFDAAKNHVKVYEVSPLPDVAAKRARPVRHTFNHEKILLWLAAQDEPKNADEIAAAIGCTVASVRQIARAQRERAPFPVPFARIYVHSHGLRKNNTFALYAVGNKPDAEYKRVPAAQQDREYRERNKTLLAMRQITRKAMLDGGDVTNVMDWMLRVNEAIAA